MIKVYNKNGDEMLIPRDEFRKNVLPRQLKDAWNNPDALYTAIIFALRDGFFEEIDKATKQLLKIDKNVERSYIVRSILLMNIGRPRKARDLLNKYIKRFGKTGVILTNLAKTHAEQGDQKTAREILLDGLKLDPNQENAVSWWGAIFYEAGGKIGQYEAMKDIASIKGSWRPQIYIAHYHLEQGELDEAIALYRDVLSTAPNEPQAMMMISGDLGTSGYTQEMISIIKPLYNPTIHGPYAGINLLQAFLESEDYKNGQQLLAKLRKLNRFDLQNHLDHYQNAFNELKHQ